MPLSSPNLGRYILTLFRPVRLTVTVRLAVQNLIFEMVHTGRLMFRKGNLNFEDNTKNIDEINNNKVLSSVQPKPGFGTKVQFRYGSRIFFFFNLFFSCFKFFSFFPTFWGDTTFYKLENKAISSKII